MNKTDESKGAGDISGAKMTTQIRNMTNADTEKVGKLLYESFNAVATKYGYAQKMKKAETGMSWAWSLLHQGSNEILIAEVGDSLAGICCLNPRGTMGGVGPVAVDTAFQGAGVGIELMHALLQRAKNLQSLRLIQEAYNPASFYFYYKFNFLPVESLVDLCLAQGAGVNLELCDNIREMTAEDLEEVDLYDRPKSKSNRRLDITYYVRWGKVFIYQSRGEICGYLACLPGSETVQLGPLLADGEEEAIRLIRHAGAVFKNRSCQTRIMARNSVLVAALIKSGFRIYCLDTLMVRGAWRPGKYVESLGIFPEGV